MNLRLLIWDLDSLTCKLCLHNKVGQGTAFNIPTVLFYSSIFLHICRSLYILGNFLPSLALLTEMICQYFQFFVCQKKFPVRHVINITNIIHNNFANFIILISSRRSSRELGQQLGFGGSLLPVLPPDDRPCTTLAPPTPNLLLRTSTLAYPSCCHQSSLLLPPLPLLFPLQLHSYHPVSPPSDAFNNNSPLLFHLHLFH